MSFFNARMVDAVEDIVLSDFLSDNSPQKYQPYIRLTKYLYQCPNVLKIIENIDIEEKDLRTPGISLLNNGTLFSSWAKKGPRLVCVASQYVWNWMTQDPFNVTSHYKSGRSFFS